jgi:hypothetical protein
MSHCTWLYTTDALALTHNEETVVYLVGIWLPAILLILKEAYGLLFYFQAAPKTVRRLKCVRSKKYRPNRRLFACGPHGDW